MEVERNGTGNIDLFQASINEINKCFLDKIMIWRLNHYTSPLKN